MLIMSVSPRGVWVLEVLEVPRRVHDEPAPSREYEPTDGKGPGIKRYESYTSFSVVPMSGSMSE